ncbi:MAG: hypothetical protein AAB865_00260 [Patescibacteria group bacterium]
MDKLPSLDRPAPTIELKSFKEMVAENALRPEPAKETPRKEEGAVLEAEALEGAREMVAEALRTPSASEAKIDATLLGDFSLEDVDGKEVRLKESDYSVVAKQLQKLKQAGGSFQQLLGGRPIAARYDIHVNNFSTRTNIIELPDGRRVFAVFAHKASALHRSLDSVMKHGAGLRMGKVSRDEWKTAFEEHGRIPRIKNEDPHTILMPYIPNVNAYDALANNHEITNFGEIPWANELTAEKKNELLRAIMGEIADIHRQGIAWGEAILPNLILTKDKRAIMCDPEVRYDEDVPLSEAQGRDLRDLILSTCAALRKSEQTKDFASVVKLLLDAYPDETVIDALKKSSGESFSLGLQLTFWNEKLRTGVESKKEYQAILQAVRDYQRAA